MIEVVLFLLLVALQVVDTATTLIALDHGYKEANPLMNWAMKTFGEATTLVVSKLALLVAVFAAGYPKVVTVPLCVLYAGVVLWNTSRIKRG